MNALRYIAIAAAGLSLAGCQSLLSPFGAPKSARLSPTLERDIADGYFHERAEQGRRLLAQGNYASAIDAFRQAATDPKQRAKSLNGLAVAYAALERYDLARRYFQEAMLADPSDVRFAANAQRLEDSLAANASRERLAQADIATDAPKPDLQAASQPPVAKPAEIQEKRLLAPVATSRPAAKLASSVVRIELPTVRQVKTGPNEILITSRPTRENQPARQASRTPVRIVLSDVPRR